MDTVTHIAGPVITVNGRAIQRCPICGELLVDSKGQMGEVEPDGSAPRILIWPQGAMVQYTVGTNPRRETVIEPEVKDRLPPDSCIKLIE